MTVADPKISKSEDAIEYCVSAATSFIAKSTHELRACLCLPLCDAVLAEHIARDNKIILFTIKVSLYSKR